MKTVSSQDFIANHNRYFDMAMKEKVVVKRDECTFHIIRVIDTTPNKQKILKPDEDLRNAITMNELRESAHKHISHLFAKK